MPKAAILGALQNGFPRCHPTPCGSTPSLNLIFTLKIDVPIVLF